MPTTSTMPPAVTAAVGAGASAGAGAGVSHQLRLDNTGAVLRVAIDATTGEMRIPHFEMRIQHFEMRVQLSTAFSGRTFG
jgi:hypothetical protein